MGTITWEAASGLDSDYGISMGRSIALDRASVTLGAGKSAAMTAMSKIQAICGTMISLKKSHLL